MIEVTERSWFKRAWTLQEIVLAKNAIVFCGLAEMSWEAMTVTLKCLGDVETRVSSYGKTPPGQNWEFFSSELALCRALYTELMIPNRPDSISRKVYAPISRCATKVLDRALFRPTFSSKKDLVLSLNTGSGLSTSQRVQLLIRAITLRPVALLPRVTATLRASRSRDATNPRDKVYGIYGLLQAQGFDDLPAVDYQKAAADIYTEITQYAIQKDRSLTILLDIVGVDGIPGLPSWVPYRSNNNVALSFFHEQFNASGHFPATYSFAANKELVLQGMVFDAVDCISIYSTTLLETPYEDPRTYSLLESVVSVPIFQEWVRLGLRQQTYPTGQPILDALAMTLVCDGVTGERPGWRQPKLFLANFQTWLNILLSNDPQIGVGVRKLQEQMEGWPGAAAARKALQELGLDLDPETAAEEAIIFSAIYCSGAALFHSTAVRYARQRIFLTTQRGFFALAPRSARQGDSVVLLSGLQYPFVLRRNGGKWRILGPAYVHGVMDGEAWPQAQGPLTSFLIA